LHRRDHELQQAQARLDQVLRRLDGRRAERYDPQQPSLFAAPAAVSAGTPATASAIETGAEANAPARRSPTAATATEITSPRLRLHDTQPKAMPARAAGPYALSGPERSQNVAGRPGGRN
jgi:hypothetical protein